MYKIILKRKPQRYLETLQPKTKKRIIDAILELKYNPHSGDIKKLNGKYDGMYRLRIGMYRILYTINHKQNEIIIFYIDKRGDIY